MDRKLSEDSIKEIRSFLKRFYIDADSMKVFTSELYARKRECKAEVLNDLNSCLICNKKIIYKTINIEPVLLELFKEKFERLSRNKILFLIDRYGDYRIKDVGFKDVHISDIALISCRDCAFAIKVAIESYLIYFQEQMSLMSQETS